MKLKKTLITTALVVGSLWVGGTALQAQDATTNSTPATTPPGTPRPHVDRFDRFARGLNMTDAQKTKAKPIMEDYFTQMQDTTKDTTLTVVQKRAKLKEVRDAVTAKLKDILTPDQLAKWEAMGPGNRRPPTSIGIPAPSTPPAAAKPQQ
jgi:Spy/CpxP family protein refolding chaperone